MEGVGVVVGGEDLHEAGVGWGFTGGEDGGKGLVCVSFHLNFLFAVLVYGFFLGWRYEMEDCGKEDQMRDNNGSLACCEGLQDRCRDLMAMIDWVAMRLQNRGSWPNVILVLARIS